MMVINFTLNNVDLHILLCAMHIFLGISYSFDLPSDFYYINGVASKPYQGAHD